MQLQSSLTSRIDKPSASGANLFMNKEIEIKLKELEKRIGYLESYIQKYSVLAIQDEIWKPIIGYEGLYEVSDLGRFKSIGGYSHSLLGTDRSNVHYTRISLCKDGETKHFSAHRVVAIHFVDNDDPINKTNVHHKNAIRNDNRAVNLEWVTQGQNMSYAIQSGNLQPKRGIDHYRCTITEEKVLEIYNASGTHEEIAKTMGLKRQQVSKIKSGISWSHLTGHEKQKRK